MNKKFIQIHSSLNYVGGGKARKDIDDILICNGYRPVNVSNNSRCRLFRNIKLLISLVSLLFKIHAKDTVFVQYPFPLPFVKLFYCIVRNLKSKLILFIHDIDSLRNVNGEEDYKLFIVADKIIVTTEYFKDFLVEKGINAKHIFVTYIWDYLNKSPIVVTDDIRSIVFAGNLLKSKFIYKLPDLVTDFSFIIYGKPEPHDVTFDHVRYAGSFEADNTAEIKGFWGLVWDGDSIDTCSGRFGDYLRYNSSHKVGLYLSCCKPLIVWTESEICQFVLNNKLGIAVSSLREIDTVISNLSISDITEIKNSVNIFSKQVRQGYILQNILLKLS